MLASLIASKANHKSLLCLGPILAARVSAPRRGSLLHGPRLVPHSALNEWGSPADN